MMNYKDIILSRTELPTYNDGKFELYMIKQTDNTFPQEYIEKVPNKDMWFNELSITDKLRFEAEQRDKKLTIKIRIPEAKQITSMNVLKIGDNYHKVYNVYHFMNNEGYRETDLTLENYPNPQFKENIANE